MVHLHFRILKISHWLLGFICSRGWGSLATLKEVEKGPVGGHSSQSVDSLTSIIGVPKKASCGIQVSSSRGSWAVKAWKNQSFVQYEHVILRIHFICAVWSRGSDVFQTEIVQKRLLPWAPPLVLLQNTNQYLSGLGSPQIPRVQPETAVILLALSITENKKEPQIYKLRGLTWGHQMHSR